MEKFTVLYDAIHAAWKHHRMTKNLALLLIVVFIGAAVAVLANTLGWLPQPLASIIPTNLFFAIQLAFTLVLLLEVIDLIFSLADSVALAARKQLEIMSLILLRDAFKDISLLQGPIDMGTDSLILLQVLATALAGYFLFIIRGLFLKIQYVQQYTFMERYRCAKKCISLFLLLSLFVIGAYDLYSILFLGKVTQFFQMFYTSLIFSDMLIILVGQYFVWDFHVTFRNSGYAVSTLLMRIALGSPHHISAALCVLSGCYILLIAWATVRFLPQEPDAR
jgi:hypothetical protein